MKRLQRADRALGTVAYGLLQPVRLARWLRRRRPARPVRSVLLVKFWGLGSLQLLTPAVAAVRRRHPSARVDLLTLRQNRDFAAGLGVFDGVRTLDVGRAGWARLFARIARLVRELRAERYDAVYDFEFFTRFSAVVSSLSGARTSHGFAGPGAHRGGLHTHRAPFNRYWHVSRNFRQLAGGENGREVTGDDLVPFQVEPRHAAEVAALLFEHGVPGVGPLIVLNPNAGSLSLERRWPPEHFSQLAARLILEDGARVVLIGSADERGRAREVALRASAEVTRRAGGAAPGRLVDLTGRLQIGALAALFDLAHALVSNDSGPMHVAAARGTLTLGLFGPETPVMYRPLGPRAFHLYDPPACSPCINVHDNKLAVCVRGRAECLTNLSVERVIATLRAELARRTFGSASWPLSRG